MSQDPREIALHVYRRYAAEVVEDLNVCPFAKPARLAGEVALRVLETSPDSPQGAPDPRVAEEACVAIAEDLALAVGILIFPGVTMDRLAFERYVAKVRERLEVRYARSPPIALAAFHPVAEADLSSPARLVPFLRRSPDPVIQVVRLSVLEALRAPYEAGTDYLDPATITDWEALAREAPRPPLHERIAENNLRTVQRRGVAAFEAIYASIARDYAARLAHQEASEEASEEVSEEVSEEE